MARRGPGEGSVYRRRDGRWVASISLGSGKRKCYYRRTRKEAHQQLQAALQEQQRGLLMRGKPTLMKPFFTQWISSVGATVRPRSRIRYEDLVRLHLIPTLGGLTLQELAPQHILVCELCRFERSAHDDFLRHWFLSSLRRA